MYQHYFLIVCREPESVIEAGGGTGSIVTVVPLPALFRENPVIPFTNNMNSPSERALSMALAKLGLCVGSVFLKDYRRGVGGFLPNLSSSAGHGLSALSLSGPKNNSLVSVFRAADH